MQVVRLRQAARASLRTVGIDVHRYRPPEFDRRRQQAIDKLGVDLVLDVGANAGQWARSLRRSGYRGPIVSFEPLAAPFAALRQASSSDALWQCRNLALGEHEGTATINVSANSWSSSLLPIGGRHTRAAPESAYIAQEQVRVACLDGLKDTGVERASHPYLKLDVQGYESQVLAGAPDTASRCVAIEIELSLVPLYEGQTLFADMLALLDALGFEPFAFEDEFVDAETGRLLQTNGVFVRRDSGL